MLTYSAAELLGPFSIIKVLQHMYKMSGLKLNMIPQIMEFCTESKMRWKMERMVSTGKVSWLQESQFAVSLIVRFEVLFSNVTVTLFLRIKIKLVLSLECFGISLGETSSPALQGIRLNSNRTFLDTACERDVAACLCLCQPRC